MPESKDKVASSPPSQAPPTNSPSPGESGHWAWVKDEEPEKKAGDGICKYLLAFLCFILGCVAVAVGLLWYFNRGACPADRKPCTVDHALQLINFNGKLGAPITELHAHNCKLCWMSNQNKEYELKQVEETNGTSCKPPTPTDPLLCDCNVAPYCVYIHCSTQFGSRSAPLDGGICTGETNVEMSIDNQQLIGASQLDYIMVSKTESGAGPTPPYTTPGPTLAPAPAPAPFIAYTSKAVSKGDDHIPLTDYSGVSVGDKISISDSVTKISEQRGIVGLGSIIVDRPLNYSYGSNAAITIIQKANSTNTGWLTAWQGAQMQAAVQGLPNQSVTNATPGPSSTPPTPAPIVGY